ncbi:hypothetical protein QYS49_00340 [Marivirga salinae]|uniref:DUF2178 domain-containing protein n=1 Tax=Marivirga salinarum TaxID=3059078 RepID=A0AA49GC11_9BACT|nr:hypothetical protein [Marivirga sp. BDSF4-3]WKK75948.2 hypothetical protein QYS49_00340 [Marivirga sp. BDSF4-3]
MTKPRKNIEKWLLPTIFAFIFIAGLLNSGRLDEYDLIESLLEIILLGFVIGLIYLMWKKSTSDNATFPEKAVQLTRILSGTVLFLSLALIISNELNQHLGFKTALIISGVVSALGLILSTIIYRVIKSK